MYESDALGGSPTKVVSLAVWSGLAVLLAASLSCAKMGAPRGGPEDRDPPQVIAAEPDSGAVSVPLDLPLSFSFSEAMNKSSVQDWMQIAPWPGKLQWRWRQNQVIINPRNGWELNETYTVLLMKQASDRRRNTLERPFALVFSTGESIPLGRLAGEVRSRSLPNEGQLVALFRRRNDEPRPDLAGFEPPPVRTALRLAQSGEDGAFLLRHVPEAGSYLLGVLHDASGNRSYDPEADLWVFWPELLGGPDTLSASSRPIYLVYDDEPGDLQGTVIDSTCLGFKQPAQLRAEADSLTRMLTGELDAMGFAPDPDSLVNFTLSEAQEESLQVRLGQVEGWLEDALRDSARCSAPIWVSLFETEDSTAVDLIQTQSDFELRDVRSGVYRLEAYRDLNGDEVVGPEEPRGAFALPVELLPGRIVRGIEIVLEMP